MRLALVIINSLGKCALEVFIYEWKAYPLIVGCNYDDGPLLDGAWHHVSKQIKEICAQSSFIEF